jgi:hypothetical protein
MISVEDHIVRNATPRLAPEETPNVYGPASGLRKSVCMIKPETDKAPPARIAVTAFGRRMACNIFCSMGLRSPHGHNQILPLHISKQNRTANSPANAINMPVFRFSIAIQPVLHSNSARKVTTKIAYTQKKITI